MRETWGAGRIWIDTMSSHIVRLAALLILLGLLLQKDVDPKDRELIPRTGRPGTPDALRKAVQLILHCPESQLA